MNEYGFDPHKWNTWRYDEQGKILKLCSGDDCKMFALNFIQVLNDLSMIQISVNDGIWTDSFSISYLEDHPNFDTKNTFELKSALNTCMVLMEVGTPAHCDFAHCLHQFNPYIFLVMGQGYDSSEIVCTSEGRYP